MPLLLPDNPDLSLLKKQAKKLLRAFQQQQTQALTTVAAWHPAPPTFQSLRDAQLVVARSYGYAGWNDLKEAVELARLDHLSLAERADKLLDLACLTYTAQDCPQRRHRAARLLAKFPALAEFNLATAVVANNLTAVRCFLQSDPTLAQRTTGPHAWPAILYLTYNRLDEAAQHPECLTIARCLLEAGADPNSHMGGEYRFTALTGAMGEGERGCENQPAHPFAMELATLLLQAGADANDSQGLYNTQFTDGGDRWLKLLVAFGLNSQAMPNWRSEPAPITLFNYLLGQAVKAGRAERVAYLLERGADPLIRDFYNQRSLYTNAFLSGYPEIAQLLLDAGATAAPFTPQETLLKLARNDDRNALAELLVAHPELLHDAELIYEATDVGSDTLVDFLLQHGFDICTRSEVSGHTLLQRMAMRGRLKDVKRLVELGADVSVEDSIHHGDPLNWAYFHDQRNVVDYLLSFSTDLEQLCLFAEVGRIRQLLQEDSTRLQVKSAMGNGLLHCIGGWLDDGEKFDACAELIDLLLHYGLDINTLNKEGQTPLAFHQARDADALVELFLERRATG